MKRNKKTQSTSPPGVGTSSTSLGSDEVDLRRRKRMISNRESARRSRMRKQKRIDHLTAESGQLVEENQRVRASLKVAAEGYTRVEYENSVLRAQMEELSQRLKSLNEIVGVLGNGIGGLCSFGSNGGGSTSVDPNEWHLNQGGYQYGVCLQ